MTAGPDLGAWLRQQREQRSWTRTEMARRLIKVAQVSGDTQIKLTSIEPSADPGTGT
jgi:hypothetical protein